MNASTNGSTESYSKPYRPANVSRGPRPAKGHDAILKKAQESGKNVTFYLIGSGTNCMTGTVVERDRYTVSVKVGDTVRVLFKHGVLHFTVQA